MSDENEEYVRSVWESVVSERWEGRNNISGDGPYVSIQITPSSEDGMIGIGIDYSNGNYYEAEAWSAARAFTEARLEEIRQVEGELAEIHGELVRSSDQMDYTLTEGRSTGASYWAMKKYRWSRILARTQAHLETLRKGMKA